MLKKRIICGLSGGMDSTTMVGKFLDDGNHVLTINFKYGSKHNFYEYEAQRKVFDFYKKKYTDFLIGSPMELDLTHIFRNMSSNLLKTGGDIPEGHYTDSSMSLTVVPGRNSIFTMIMMGIAQTLNYDAVALGIHQGDHAIYPDCRKEYYEYLKKTVELATESTVTVLAPFIDIDKTKIIQEGMKFNAPYVLTRTCYKNQETSCGKCGSCVERLEAFRNNNIPDPIKYDEE